MREILFRGKSQYTGKWGESVCPLGMMQSGHLCNDFIPETVGQFTGLTDKNGKKIFEGDILRAKVYETAIEDSEVFGKQKIRTGNKIDAVWTVEHKIFNATCGYFIYGKDRRFHRLLTYSVIFNNECEVIGNIHDNPELLNGGLEDEN